MKAIRYRAGWLDCSGRIFMGEKLSSYSFREFYDRIVFGHDSDDQQWRTEAGYRPEDKDSGYRRWLELTGNDFEKYLPVFQHVVYGLPESIIPAELMRFNSAQQIELF